MTYESLTRLEELLYELTQQGTTCGAEIKKVRGVVNRMRGKLTTRMVSMVQS